MTSNGKKEVLVAALHWQLSTPKLRYTQKAYLSLCVIITMKSSPIGWFFN